MNTEEKVLWVLVGAAVGAAAIYLLMTLMKKRCRPGRCSNIRHIKKRVEGFSANFGFASGANEPQWFITWTPPTVGTGTGYTVTYSGSMVDSNKKQVYAFKQITDPGFTLPDSTPPGTYSVSVTATNQVGDGPEYTQEVTLGDHTPKFTGQANVGFNPVGNKQMISDVYAFVPDIPKEGIDNTKPGSYTVTYTVKDSKGNDVPLTDTSWKLVPNGAHYVGYFPYSVTPGEQFTMTWSICNYDLCTSQTWLYTQFGYKPGASSNLGARFGM